jgi:peptidoglycan/xylan/chitin deacetylase (PgdA/CDA1 family)
MYHQVGRFAPMRTHRATYCRSDRFQTQMRWLAWSRTPVISLERALRALTGEEPLDAASVVLTFDDAYQSFYDIVLPVLKRFGFPATVYVPTAFIGGRAEWLAVDGLHPAPILSADRLRELANGNDVAIGAHGVNHRPLAKIPRAEVWQEIAGGKAALEAVLGQEVRHLCYPYGSVNTEIMNLAAAAGFSSGTTCQRGAVPDDADALGLPRKAISYGDDLLGFIWKIHFKHKLKGAPVRREA